MSKDVPNPNDITAAHTYAMSRLCLEIPEKFGEPGITRWDDVDKVCRITKKGCQPDVRNPISQPLFDHDGNIIKQDMSNVMFSEFWKRHRPGYYVWRTTKDSPREEVCARGNYLMQRWCEYPKSRGDKDIPGVTDAEPFKYVIRNGIELCEIPKSYCEAKGVSYDEEKKDCYVPKSQQLAEFFTSSVLIRSQRASDKRLKKIIKVIKENFPVQGVNVYLYEWNDIALTVYGFSGMEIGFLADELDDKYIKLDPLGYKVINTDYEDDTMMKIKSFLRIIDVTKNIVYN
jgi:hypothetical protein